VDSNSNLKSCAVGISQFVYFFNSDHLILYTCRMFTYESDRSRASWASLRVGNRFLVFFDVASGWSGVGAIGKYQARLRTWKSFDLLYNSLSVLPCNDDILKGLAMARLRSK
jgi:hypothetical protein